MDNKVTIESIITLQGKKFTMEEFQAKCGAQSIAQAVKVAQILVNQGKATIYEEQTDVDMMIAKALQQDSVEQLAQQIVQEEEDAQTARREASKQDRDLTGIALDFDNSILARKAEEWINNVMHIDDTEISTRKGQITLKVRNITPEEYNKIAKKYNLDMGVQKVVGVTRKGASAVTNGFNYAATEVITPLGVISEEVTWAVAKTAVSALAKFGAGLINTGARAYQETKYALATDPELIRAQGQVLDAKNKAMRVIAEKNKNSMSGAGIRRLED